MKDTNKKGKKIKIKIGYFVFCLIKNIKCAAGYYSEGGTKEALLSFERELQFMMTHKHRKSEIVTCKMRSFLTVIAPEVIRRLKTT